MKTNPNSPKEVSTAGLKTSHVISIHSTSYSSIHNSWSTGEYYDSVLFILRSSGNFYSHTKRWKRKVNSYIGKTLCMTFLLRTWLGSINPRTLKMPTRAVNTTQVVLKA